MRKLLWLIDWYHPWRRRKGLGVGHRRSPIPIKRADHTCKLFENSRYRRNWMPITTLDGTRRLLLSPASLCLSVSLLPLLPLSGRFIGSSVHRSRLRILLSNYTVTCNRSCQLAALFFLPECNPFFFAKDPEEDYDSTPPFSLLLSLFLSLSFEWFRRDKGVVSWSFSFDKDFGGRGRIQQRNSPKNERGLIKINRKPDFEDISFFFFFFFFSKQVKSFLYYLK